MTPEQVALSLFNSYLEQAKNPLQPLNEHPSRPRRTHLFKAFGRKLLSTRKTDSGWPIFTPIDYRTAAKKKNRPKKRPADARIADPEGGD